MPSYQYISQVNPPKVMQPGETASCSLTIKNTSGRTWQRDVTNADRIGQRNTTPTADCPFYAGPPTGTGGWCNVSRIQLPQASVANNETITIPFTVKAPLYGGRFKAYFVPLQENVAWMEDIGIYFTTYVPAPVLAFHFMWYEVRSGVPYRWDTPPTGKTFKTKDTPNFGTVNYKYDSSDPAVIAQQLDNYFNVCGFDGLVLDKWLDNDSTGDPNISHINSAAAEVISQIETDYPTKTFCFLIEPPADGNQTAVAIPQATYDALYTAYGSHSQYQKSRGKMLLFTFYPRTSGIPDSRFFVEPMSNDNRSGYSNYFRNPPDLNGRSHLSIIQRWDVSHYNTTPVPVNPALDSNTPDDQFGYALRNKDLIALLTIPGNEFYERTNIPEVSASGRTQIKAFIDLFKAEIT